MKWIVLIVALIISLLLPLMKYGYIVFDRNVFYFQVSHIIERGKINNIREYKVMHNYIEMLFERDAHEFNKNPAVDKLNLMMNEFHEKMS